MQTMSDADDFTFSNSFEVICDDIFLFKSAISARASTFFDSNWRWSLFSISWEL